jgi:hypothetical protein
MNKEDAIEIRQLANGYIVMPTNQEHRYVLDNERFVFQTFSELQDWLQEHFTYRASYVKKDVEVEDRASE